MKRSPYILLAIFITIVSLLTCSAREKETYSVLLKILPSDYTIQIDGSPIKPQKIDEYRSRIFLSQGKHTLRISAPGYYSDSIKLSVDRENNEFEHKLEKRSAILNRIKETKTGRQPKSVSFTPEGKYCVTAHLAGNGIEFFDAKTLKSIKQISIPEQFSMHKGFVEMAYIERFGELWVSQMTTGLIHVIDYRRLYYKYSFPVNGTMPKVIAVSNNEDRAFVSSWISRDISVIDVTQHKVVQNIRVGGIPRGMVVTDDDAFLYVCLFNNGNIKKIDLHTLSIVKTINLKAGAKRHIVYDSNRNRLYVSDMARGSIFVISVKDDSLIREIFVDHKLNTIDLTEDGNYLFVSSRGPNNVKSYLEKGPRYGKIYMIDTTTYKTVEWVWGKNQPTGLALSPDDKYIAFTNLLDDSLELYKIAPILPLTEYAKDDTELTLCAVGDILLDRGIRTRIRRNGVNYPFNNISHFIRMYDLAFCNLECSVSSNGKPLNKKYCFNAKPEYFKGIKNAGFNIISIANNHTLDWGYSAFLQTKKIIEDSELFAVGGGRDQAEARSPTIVESKNIKIAFLGYISPYLLGGTYPKDKPSPGSAYPNDIVKEIKKVRDLVDYVVVSLHWGVEYQEEPTKRQVNFAHRLIDEGADLILGHHPHVLQRIENYKDKYIVYSLGNFVFDQHHSYQKQSIIFCCHFQKEGITRAYFIPVLLADFRPRIALGKDAETIFNKIKRLSEPYSVKLVENTGYVSVFQPRSDYVLAIKSRPSLTVR